MRLLIKIKNVFNCNPKYIKTLYNNLEKSKLNPKTRVFEKYERRVSKKNNVSEVIALLG